MNEPRKMRVETLPQPPDDAIRDAIYAFWLRQLGDMDRGAAAQRLGRVLAFGLDDNDAVVATCSAVPARVAAMGHQMMLVYRSLLAGAFNTPDNWMAMVTRAWELVEAQQAAGEHAGCIGLLVPVTEAAVPAARPEAVWAENGLIHAGYGQRGFPLRVRHFADARLHIEGVT